MLKPFWRYYGGKWRAAPHYPEPLHRTIVEPFAGAAGYALRHHSADVVLVDKYPVVAGIWRYLIGASPSEIRRIPLVESTDDLPDWVPQEARWLIGFQMNAGTTSPCRNLSAGRRKLAAMGRKYEGWTHAMRERVAIQVPYIRHWRIIEGDYTMAPDVVATWFIDPPYNNKAGSYYKIRDVNYGALAQWCKSRRGQVMVCENEGASWLPFKFFRQLKPGVNNRMGGSREMLWGNH